MRTRLAVALLTLAGALLWTSGTLAEGPLTLEGRTASSLTVSWIWNGQPASAWDLAWRARGDDDLAAWRSVRKTAAQRRHTIEGLEAGVRYIVRVRALDANDRPFASLQGSFATSSAAAGQRPDPRLRRGLAERLTLELESSRELCTAGTLTEVSWQISGGKPPYALQIEGVPVDVDADNARINCGALSEAEAADENGELAAKRITATVTDARGVRREAAINVARARALPAPTGFSHWSYPHFAVVTWRDVSGVGTLSVPGSAPDGRAIQLQLDAYLVRYRPDVSTPWMYALDKRQQEESPWARVGDGLHMLSVAALRDPIEQFTPDALTWSPSYYYGRVQAPVNVAVTATHDTVTVTWDRQPRTNPGWVFLSSSGGLLIRSFGPTQEAGQGTVIFRNLPPGTAFEATVRLDTNGWPGPNETTALVRTDPAPVDFEPPERDPQNLRATATNDSITVTWTLPYPDPHARHRVAVFDAQTGHQVVSRWTHDGETSVTLTGGIFPIWPSTRYRVAVYLLSSIPRGQSEVYVTTLPVRAAREP